MLESFLHNNSKAFLDVVNRWSTISPPLFNQQLLLQRLETKNMYSSTAVSDNMIGSANTYNNGSHSSISIENRNANSSDGSNHNQSDGGMLPLYSNTDGRGKGTSGGGLSQNINVKSQRSVVKVQSWHLIEAQAQLHVVLGENEKALNCYLNVKTAYTESNGDNDENEKHLNEINSNNDVNNNNRNATSNNVGGSSSSSSSTGTVVGKNTVKKHPYRHVFDLIQREVRKREHKNVLDKEILKELLLATAHCFRSAKLIFTLLYSTLLYPPLNFICIPSYQTLV